MRKQTSIENNVKNGSIDMDALMNQGRSLHDQAIANFFSNFFSKSKESTSKHSFAIKGTAMQG